MNEKPLHLCAFVCVCVCVCACVCTPVLFLAGCCLLTLSFSYYTGTLPPVLQLPRSCLCYSSTSCTTQVCMYVKFNMHPIQLHKVPLAQLTTLELLIVDCIMSACGVALLL